MSVDQRVQPISAEDFYKMIRGQVEHEDSLIAQRLSWFVAAQSFLFTAYAITLNAPGQAFSRMFADQIPLLNILIPAVAICFCGVIYTTVLGGVLALRNLREALAKAVHRDAIAHFPPVQGTTVTRIMGHAAPVFLPPMFGCVWIILLVHFVR